MRALVRLLNDRLFSASDLRFFLAVVIFVVAAYFVVAVVVDAVIPGAEEGAVRGGG